MIQRLKWILSFALLVVFCAGCSNYEIKLPNDYHLVRTNGDEAVVSEPSRVVVVGPTVNNYSVHDQLVIGYVRRKGYLPPDINVEDGYFILNTATGSIEQGLSKEKWIARLKQLEITDIRLSRP